MRLRAGWAVSAVLLVLAGCRDELMVQAGASMSLSEEALDFGLVRPGDSARRQVVVVNLGRVRLNLTRVQVVADPAAPGGEAAFAVPAAPAAVDREAALEIAFTPAALGDHRALLKLESDDADPDRRLQVLRLAGRGATPRVRLVPACTAPCSEFSATLDPPALDFGAQLPLRRGATGVRVEPAWPTVTLLNEGELPLTLSGAELRGDASFSTVESLNAQGQVVPPGGSLAVHVAFDPAGSTPRAMDARLLVWTDDPQAPEASVALTGALAPNRPPTVCAAVVEARQPDGAMSYPHDQNGALAFGGFVAVQPGDQALVQLSAYSDHFLPGLHPHEMDQGDPAACTTDPEDGREALRYQWTVLSRPAGSAAELIDPDTPEPLFRPDAIGAYALRLTATDFWGASASADVEFEALPVRDLAVQLSWERQGGVDLDVHLVKPGPCADQADCLFHRLGDLDGWLASRTGGVFDWGLPGVDWDDPRLDVDDQGDGSLIEIASLNYPQLDPACRAARCTYDVYVHYFKDWRADSAIAPACPGRPCEAGSACGCPEAGAGADAVCVSGRCVRPLRPTVKVYLQPTAASFAPALELPLPGESLSLASPCALWHVARIHWPSVEELYRDPKAAPTVEAVGLPGQRSLAFYGSLAAGSFSCAPNSPPGTPAEEVTFLPGTAPVCR